MIEKMVQHVKAECAPVDLEEQFRETLDEIYTFESVGGPFACMQPSRVLEEIDPVAFRCGVAESSDYLDVVEIDGDYYYSDDVETARDEFLDGLREAMEQPELSDDEIDKLEDAILECQAHVF